jgi:hypothetical protein
MIGAVVEHVQVERVARVWAGVASAYCLALGIAFSWADAESREYEWFLAATFLVITVIPQWFSSRRAFVRACWTSIVLIGARCLALFLGGCPFVGAALPLIAATLIPARAHAEPAAAEGKS